MHPLQAAQQFRSAPGPKSSKVGSSPSKASPSKEATAQPQKSPSPVKSTPVKKSPFDESMNSIPQGEGDEDETVREEVRSTDNMIFIVDDGRDVADEWE